MRITKLRTHLLISLLLSGIPYLTFMVTREMGLDIFPDRDKLSAYMHLIAVLIIGYRFIRLGDYRRNWIYLPVLAFAFVMFLEESELFTEITFLGRGFYYHYRPQFVIPYLEKHGIADLRFRSFHVFFQFLFTQWWKDYYDAESLRLLFQQNLRALGMPILFVLLQRRPHQSQDDKKRLVSHFSIAGLLLGVFGILQMAALSKQSGAEDIEVLRLGSIAVLLILSILLVLLLLNTSGAKQTFVQWLDRQAGDLRRRLIWLAVLLIVGAGLLALQIHVTRFDLDLSPAKTALAITAIALVLVGFFLWALLLTSWNGFYHWPVKRYWSRLRAFLLENPTFFYVGGYALLMLFAQLIDWHVINREGLRFVREEVIEWVSTFQLIVAGFLIPGKRRNVD